MYTSANRTNQSENQRSVSTQRNNDCVSCTPSQFIDQRPETIQQTIIQAQMMGVAPAQLKSKVVHQEQELKGEDGHGVEYKQLAGKKMTAILDPQYPLKGSQPGGGKIYNMYAILNRDWNESWIKGHLLNDNLGGLGIPENLFPITAAANKSHLNRVEQHVKNAVLNLTDYVNYDPPKRNKSYVEYTVEAIPENKDDFIDKPNAKLKCNATTRKRDTNTNYVGIDQFIKDQEITSKPSGPQSEGHNEALGKLGWGSSGSGTRRSGTGDKGKVKYVSDSNYFHVEFANKTNNKYEKWHYTGTKWVKRFSEDQSPISIERE